METSMNAIAAAIVLALSASAHASGKSDTSLSLIETFSQQELLKNWTLSVCLAVIAKDTNGKEDANATAAAYLELGRQRIEAYDELRKLAKKYAARRYGGPIQSEYNTMKCIDMFYSEELDRLTKKLSKAP